MLDSLNPHPKVLYDIIKEGKEVRPFDLYESYKNKCKEKGLETIVERTIRKYLEKMVKMGLVQTEGKDRWRVYKTRE